MCTCMRICTCMYVCVITSTIYNNIIIFIL
nr:MAG TPA: hypothetical protein [Crassvirales sp.]